MKRVRYNKKQNALWWLFRLLIALPLLFFLAFLFLPGLSTSAKTTKLIVHRGTAFNTVLTTLYKHGAITELWQVHVTAQIVPKLASIKAGRYTIPGNLSNFGLLYYLHTRPLDEVKITLPEGLESRKVARIFARHLDFDSTAFMQTLSNEKLLAKYGINAEHAEGYLLPGTYHFAWASTPEESAGFLIQQFRRFYTKQRQLLALKHGLHETEVLTLASIVEAETPRDTEKPLIASVYLNRLRNNMRLQADPTVQYALGGNARRLFHNDLKIDSPYNTYRHKGLPPGPICNPSKASILAVLHPAQTPFLYFVATGTGGHYFAESLQAHHANIVKYKNARRNQP